MLVIFAKSREYEVGIFYVYILSVHSCNSVVVVLMKHLLGPGADMVSRLEVWRTLSFPDWWIWSNRKQKKEKKKQEKRDWLWLWLLWIWIWIWTWNRVCFFSLFFFLLSFFLCIYMYMYLSQVLNNKNFELTVDGWPSLDRRINSLSLSLPFERRTYVIS